MRKQRAIGLDVGAFSTKLAIVEKHRAGARIVHTARYCQAQEGILDQAELREALADWLKQEGARAGETVAGIPQALVNMRLAEFPPASRKRLAEMAAYEVQQFAGLSDDTFLHAFHPLDSGATQVKQQVLLAICPEPTALERADILVDGPVLLAEMAPTGAAFAAALEQVHPQATSQHGTSLFLDLGASSTTFVVYDAGHLAYIGSVPYGSEMFTEAMASELQLSEQEAESKKQEFGLAPLDELTPSPMAPCCREFVNELFAALEAWKFDGETQARPAFSHLYLAGGGARLTGFSTYLSDELGCPVQTLSGSGGPEQTDFLVAFGLGMQGLGISPLNMAITPARIGWTALRRRRHIFLAAAMAVLVVILASIVTIQYLQARKNLDHLAHAGAVLEQCAEMIPALEKQRAELTQVEAMLMPFAARGNRSATIIQTIQTLSDFQKPEDWLVYLADEVSYFDESESAEAPERPFGLGINALVTTSEQRPFLSNELTPWGELYCSGFVPKRDDDRLKHVGELLKLLNQESSIFLKADTVTSERSDKDFQVSSPWINRYRVRPFALRLPLKHVEFKSP